MLRIAYMLCRYLVYVLFLILIVFERNFQAVCFLKIVHERDRKRTITSINSTTLED